MLPDYKSGRAEAFFFFAGAALGIDTMIDRKLRGDR
jgi:hypothetical protein